MYTNARVLLAVALFLPAAVSAVAQTDEQVRQIAQARASKARSIASDPEVLQAVLAKNAERETAEQIQARDRLWMSNPADPLRRGLTESRCGQRLRELVKDDPLIAEVILMDEHGANVCVSKATSDYWQGDEAKWQRAFADGKGATFIDRLKFDESAKQNLAQISVPIMDGGHAIGVITAGVELAKIGK